MKVIIADDHALFAYMLGEFVNRISGFEVLETVKNGQELLQVLNKLGPDVPDVVLLDIDMPVMDGYEAARKIRQLFDGIKIIFISGDYNFKTIKCMDALNVEGFISKDANRDALQEAFESIAKGERVFIKPSNDIKGKVGKGSNAFKKIIEALERGQGLNP